MKRSGMLLCFVGPSGGGKSTYAKRLLADDSNFSFSVSMTSRPPREGEINGVHYEFVTKEQFMQAVENGEMFEWEEVHGNCYGTRKQTVLNSLNAGKDLLLDIDIRGALSFKRELPHNTVVVFLTPPNTEVLKSRLRARGAMSEEEFERRLNTARQEFNTLESIREGNGSEVNYFLINDDLEETYSQIQAIVKAERLALLRQNIDDIKSICLL